MERDSNRKQLQLFLVFVSLPCFFKVRVEAPCLAEPSSQLIGWNCTPAMWRYVAEASKLYALVFLLGVTLDQSVFGEI